MTDPVPAAPGGHPAAKHLVLVVDDLRDNVQMLAAHLRAKGYRTLTAYNGAEALELAASKAPDLIMLDVNMPGLSGLEVCSRLKQSPATALTPVILVTAHSDAEDIVRGFEVGADDYLIKPYNYMEMLARVRSMLRIRDSQQELLRANQLLDELNRDLGLKVREQVAELERANRLRRFFSPQIVRTIVSENESQLREHRAEVTVVFLDLRQFTAFAEQATSQEIIRTLRELHEAVGPIIFEYKGTLERFAGDGLMVFLGDPEPMEDHAAQAVRMCLKLRQEAARLAELWAERGYDLKLGMGAATGIAVLGTIGFEGRLDYAAIGTVTNLAARLCAQAHGGQVLISQSTYEYVRDLFQCRPCGEILLKGFSRPHPIYEVE